MGTTMKPSQVLDSIRASIRSIVAPHRAGDARVFGSVRGDGAVGSNIDILAGPMSEPTRFDLSAIHHKLGKLLRVTVDVQMPNAILGQFRNAVLAEARSV